MFVCIYMCLSVCAIILDILARICRNKRRDLKIYQFKEGPMEAKQGWTIIIGLYIRLLILREQGAWNMVNVGGNPRWWGSWTSHESIWEVLSKRKEIVASTSSTSTLSMNWWWCQWWWQWEEWGEVAEFHDLLRIETADGLDFGWGGKERNPARVTGF